MGALLLAFLVVPAVELSLLLEVGSRIGTASTLLIIVVTGILGANLARHQGLQVLRRIEADTRTGEMPGDALLDGAIVILAGALLVTPGILTDAVGLLCLVPATRRPLREYLRRRFAERVRQGTARMDVQFTSASRESRSGPVYDITPEPERPSPRQAPATSEGAKGD